MSLITITVVSLMASFVQDYIGRHSSVSALLDYSGNLISEYKAYLSALREHRLYGGSSTDDYNFALWENRIEARRDLIRSIAALRGRDAARRIKRVTAGIWTEDEVDAYNSLNFAEDPLTREDLVELSAPETPVGMILKYEEYEFDSNESSWDNSDFFQDWLSDKKFIVECFNYNGHMAIVETIAAPSEEMADYIADLLLEAGCEDVEVRSY